MAIIYGTAGDDSLVGTKGADDFHLEQGGVDTVSGGAGKDVFYMGATLTSADHIDGGGGGDVVVLDGDYSAGLSLTPSTVVRVESFLLTAGHDYSLSGLTDANFGAKAAVFGGTLGSGDSMHVDASGMTKAIHLLGGAGSDILIGGSGYNTLDAGASGHDKLIGGDAGNEFFLGGGRTIAKGGDGGDMFTQDFGRDFQVSDKIDGGGGDDSMIVYNPSGDIAFHNGTIKDIETLTLWAGQQFDVVLADGNVAAGQTMRIELDTNATFTLDGSKETDGTLIIDDNNGAEDHGTLIGGAGDDTIYANQAGSVVEGGGGADNLIGQAGNNKFVYLAVSDSSADAPDMITGLNASNVIDLRAIDADTTQAGDQAFHLVSALDGHAGELVVSYDTARHFTSILGDVDGDGIADLVINVDGNESGFNHFVL